MKKRKLKERLNCSNQLLRNAGEQNNVLANTNAAARRELADLRQGIEGALRRNVAQSEQLDLAHEAYKNLEAQLAAAQTANAKLLAANIECTARVRKQDEMLARIQAMCGSEDV